MSIKILNSIISFKILSQFCGFFTAAIGALAIAGWLTGSMILTSINADYIPMAPNTAISFILLGILFIFLAADKRLWHNLSKIGAIVVFVLSLLRLAEFNLDITLNVDRWFFDAPAKTLGNIPVGRMALPTSLNFLFASAAFFLASFSKKNEVAEGTERLLSGATTLVGLAFSLGYIYGAPLLYGGSAIPMALNTAVAFFALGMGFVINNLGRDIAERKQAAEALKKAYDELEERIKERTLELAKANEALQAEIIEHRRAEDALRIASEEWQRTFDSTTDGISIHDSEGNILRANSALGGMLGVNSKALIGKKCYHIFHEKDDPIDGCPMIKSVQLKKASNTEIFEPLLNRWLSVTCSPLFGNKGEARGVVHVIRDITERKKLEEQFRHAQKMEAVGQLAGGVAHDFNNILNAILGFGNLIEMNMKEDDPNRIHLKEILNAGERAVHVTQGLLAFSRKQIIDPTPQDLNEIVKGVEKFLRRIIGEDIELKTLLSDRDLTGMVDVNQMQQVLMNLATNARDAMPDGGALIIETKLAELDEEFIRRHGDSEAGRYALISFSDTGTGMDETTKERIFEPFFTTKELGKGTGLGLAMVYGIIKQHNGYINVYSEEGKGTTFKIYLPLVQSSIEYKEAGETSRPSPITGGTEMILVAEDDTAVRRLTKEVLELSGYNVIESEDGEDAAARFMENKDKIQLVILDVIMPKKNGKEAYEEIKKMRPDIKAIFTSGYTADMMHKKGILEKGLNFVLKPISPKALLEKVREVLDKKDDLS